MRLCSDRHDRSRERFPRAYLERFRETLPGKSLLGNHAHREFALGRFYKAEFEEDDGVLYLVPSFYMLRTPENEEARRQIDAGVWSHVSIGFTFDTLLCDLCGKDYYDWSAAEPCLHVRGRRYNGRECTLTYAGDTTKVEAVEGSIVYLGCQYDSQVVKSAEERKEKRMEEAWKRRRGDEGGEGDEADEAGEKLTSRSSSAPSSSPSSLLTGLAADGELYRADLRAEIRRMAGICGAGKEAGFVLEVLSEAPAARLKELLEEYHARAERLFPPAGRGKPMIGPPAPERDERAPRAHSLV